MAEFQLDEIRVFENYSLEKMGDGHVLLTTDVTEHSLNYYGNAHGGYLFTLCDQVSGLVAISTGYEAVTLQSNINYLKAGHLGDRLTVEGKCLHNGRTTKIVQVSIHNQKQEQLATASFTMFVTGERKQDEK
ncbi:PaaI family thioesterase [Streptococcus saliviloxodontae]|uniref:Acyl-CoA thioesterase n=1 Tax=Streptococcus saliviloxodontae TaxID=1349416 RepID=A0ABS2PNN2_9STRE|nr:PaaI family thioesterase [Streptococcus saliviloxodontae]MBM7636706.1 acyl-CoA thioesterase [Streptococcus saliviloxodontae]